MEEKFDKITNKVIILVIILLNIFIGSNIKSPIWIIQTLISVYAFIYVFIKKIICKEKNVIIKGKIDVVVLLFMISTIIPYIAKRYVTLDRNNKFYIKILVGIWFLYFSTKYSEYEKKYISNRKCNNNIINNTNNIRV